MKLGILLILITSLMGCATGEKLDQAAIERLNKQEREVKARFNEALAYMDARQYKTAGLEFKSILQQYPTTNLELLIVYNLGGALEGLGRYKKAVSRYREVVNKSMGRQKSLEAQALIRMSYVYEYLNDDSKVVASLFSARKFESQLPRHVVLAEIPARLAAAYARQGNQAMAQRFFIEAQDGLKSVNLNVRDGDKKRELLSKTLYHMGNLKRQKVETISSENFINSLIYLQNYLLLSVELDVIGWSRRSAKEILNAYDQIYSVIQTNTKKYSNEKLSRQIEFSLNAIESLKKQHVPTEEKIKIVANLFEDLDRRRIKFERALAKLSVGNDLTIEAKKRNALKQPGTPVAR